MPARSVVAPAGARPPSGQTPARTSVVCWLTAFAISSAERRRGREGGRVEGQRHRAQAAAPARPLSRVALGQGKGFGLGAGDLGGHGRRSKGIVLDRTDSALPQAPGSDCPRRRR